MSFPSWLQNLRFALAPSRGKRPNRRPGSRRATLYRPTLEVLEDRLTFSFSSAMSFSVGPNPQAVVTGDFNNDGRLDLAVANHDDRTVGVLLGDGLGGFGAARQSAVGTIGPVSLAVADFNNDGKLDLAVISQDPVGSIWNSSMSVLLGNGDGTFRAPTYPGSTWTPLSAAAGDFNADGNIDLVVGQDDTEGAGYVEVLLGNGQGGFATARGEYSTHSLPAPSLAVGDLNGDGKLDAVMVCGPGGSGGFVFLGNGDGTFGPYDLNWPQFDTGPDPRAVAVGDFTGDGVSDLVIAGQTVDVLRGHGDGSFDAPISQTANGAMHTGVAAADFNGDGKLDAVTADADTGTVSLLLGNGNGTLTFAGAYGVGSSPSAITVGDFNGDGRLDVAAANAGSNTVSVLLNDGIWDGSPPSIAVTIAADNGTGSLRQAISDANKLPGTLDTIVFQLPAGPQTIRPASPLPDVTDPLTVSVDATQNPRVMLPPLSAWQNNSSLRLTGTGSLTIVGGLEGNGNLALDAASNLTAGHIVQGALVIGGTAGSPAVVTIAPSDASGNPLSAFSFSPAMSFPVGTTPNAVVTADFNGDGRLDLAVLNGGSDDVSILLGSGDGAFQATRNRYVLGGWNPQSLAVGDFNGDGRPDLVAPSSGSYIGGVEVLLGNGDGSFQFAQGFSTEGPSSLAVAVGDFDGDGNLDLAVTGFDADYVPGDPSAASEISVLLGHGDGTFAVAGLYEASFGLYAPSIATGDFNGDGKLDLVFTDPYGDAVGVMLGYGNFGDFTAAQYFAAGSHPVSVAVADLNGDGKPDLATTNDSGSVSVMLGNGDGAFQAARDYATGPCSSVAVADCNGDGKPDLVTATSDGVGVLLGNGDGSFRGAQVYAAGSGANSVAAGDFNGDGRLDVAAANGSSNTVSVLLNNGAWPVQNTPWLRIGDATVVEGNTGTVNAVFTVTLSDPSTGTVTVAYATGDGTATAGSDYQAASGTLTFAPGETSKTISVLVNGDRLADPNETFVVNLSGPTNATIADGQGMGTIQDDEPRISINDVTKSEGKKNQTTLLTFTVTLSAAYDQPVTLSYRTTDGTAKTSDGDYTAKTGTLTFAPGETTKTITIEVNGDNKKEADETFYLDLFGNSDNSLFTKNRGLGTILNDD